MNWGRIYLSFLDTQEELWEGMGGLVALRWSWFVSTHQSDLRGSWLVVVPQGLAYSHYWASQLQLKVPPHVTDGLYMDGG